MKEKQIRVLRVYPRHTPIPADIDNTLEALQDAVGGYIETVHITDKLVIVCNEEGKLKNLPANRELVWKLGGKDKQIVTTRDIICGDFIICGIKDGDFRSLTAREQWYLVQYFQGEEIDMTAEGLKYL
ncbi:MAG: DUF3846 domain-containing protein [Clostridia bacterium]|nr:DUF3846 domain-containing protein [Clostridia bacterium]